MQTNLSIFYGDNEAVRSISLPIYERKITAIIGPSGCGQSTFLRSLLRMNDFIDGVTHKGEILFNEENLYHESVDPVEVRLRIGMVFQKANPFPKSIFRNVAWGPNINGLEGNSELRVENALKQAALWEEVADRLDDSALNLSGGQQQRLCIARALAMEPEVILMDEPCSALDPVSTARIEDLLFELKQKFTIVIVTHNMQQAARVSDYTAFMENGVLVEFGETDQVFTRPKESRTEEYVTGPIRLGVSMTVHLQRDLDSLKKDIVHLGSLVQNSTQSVVEFLGTKSEQQLQDVLEYEDRINELEVDIEEHCLKVLALHQPVAIDLRFIIVIMKVNNDLERMGDQAVNISHRVKSLMDGPELPISLPIDEMTNAVQKMVSLSLEALVSQDPAIARKVVDMDDIVDDLNAQTYDLIRETIQANPSLVNSAMSMATISSNLERIGDLCTNIAEEVIFMVEGQVIRHQN